MQPLLEPSQIHARLREIFSGGIPNLNYVTREMAAKVAFVMIYIDAIEEAGVFLRPDQVTKMTDAQAERTSEEDRIDWRKATMRPHKGDTPGRWYQPNTREPIRDETLRQGFVTLGAAVERTDVPTTSSAGRYALTKSFAALLHPDLKGEELERAIGLWQTNHLSLGARARVFLHKQATVGGQGGVIARLPNGESRRLTDGPSSVIAKGVIEEFAPRFLEQPGLLWLSESAKKEDARDSALAEHLGLAIDAEKNLPDVILVDTGSNDTLFVFVEVVASDGPVNEDRRKALLSMVEAAGYQSRHAAFVTAYLDREGAAFRKTFSSVAWQTFAWCLTEPDKIICLRSQASQTSLRG